MKAQKRTPSDLMSPISGDAQTVEKLTRIISIRLSEMEYQELERFSRAVGARSVGDLARHSIQKALYKISADSNLATADYLYFLHKSVERLGCDVKSCTHMLSEILKSREQKAKHRVRILRKPSATVATVPGPSLPTPVAKAAGFSG